jgi:pimeloyl-ACP methyl ester carboxylesterase
VEEAAGRWTERIRDAAVVSCPGAVRARLRSTTVKTRLTLVMLLLLALMQVVHGQEQQLARIGDLRLDSGKTIRDCVIGYRTFGRLNKDKSNAVLFPTAFTSRSADLVKFIEPGKWIDSGKHFVIVVDSLGDGISSSPSNSNSQPGLDFPEFSIRDMVSAEQQRVVGALHLRHLRAVMGFSMGGEQAFQWAVSYPGFMDKTISILGSPQLTAYDLLLWRSMLLAIERLSVSGRRQSFRWVAGGRRGHRAKPDARDCEQAGPFCEFATGCRFCKDVARAGGRIGQRLRTPRLCLRNETDR